MSKKTKKSEPVTITELIIDNYMRIVAAHVVPKGNMQVIGGKNAQGKTSLIDSIMVACKGKGSIPTQPITKGADKGGIKLKLSNGLQVVRTLDPEGKHKLKVMNEDGARYDSPQKMLDALFSHLSFDPLEFANMDARPQANTLQELCGLDLDEHDSLHKALFEDRTGVNRRVKEMTARVEAMTHDGDVPDELIDPAELMTQLDEVSAHNQANMVKRDQLKSAGDAEKELQERFADLEHMKAETLKQIEDMDETIKSTGLHIAQAKANIRNMGIEVANLEDQDPAPIREMIKSADTTNGKIRANRDRVNLIADRDAAQGNADKMTEKLAKQDAARAKMIADAKMPIDGLDFGPDGVLFEGLPFDQASQSQRDIVSVAIGLALNPDAPVLLIREASRWDVDTLAKVGVMAKKARADIWVERVSEGDECTIIIEDGMIKGADDDLNDHLGEDQ